MNKFILTIPILAIIIISGCTGGGVILGSDDPDIDNYEKCIAAGNPAMESYPRQCRSHGETFVEVIDDGIIPTTQSDDISPLASYFNDQIISKGVEKIGQPIEGFDSYLLKQAFPGLIDADFDNVDALLGIYKFVNNELIFELITDGPIHSAAETVSEDGMENLMNNAAERLNIEINDEASVDELIDLLEK